MYYTVHSTPGCWHGLCTGAHLYQYRCLKLGYGRTDIGVKSCMDESCMASNPWSLHGHGGTDVPPTKLTLTLTLTTLT